MGLDDGKHLLLAGALVGGVLGTLTLAAVLQTEHDRSTDERLAPAPREESRRTAPPPDTVETTPPLAADIGIERAPAAETEDPATRPPATRAAQPRPTRPTERVDGSRHAIGTGWTLQFMTSCNDDVVQRIKSSLGGQERLFVLPVELDGRTCRRICWGDYPSREAALNDPGIPGELRKLTANPLPRRLEDLQP